MSAVAASPFTASDVGTLRFRVEARPGLVVGRDGQGGSVSALVIRLAYSWMSQVPYFGSRDREALKQPNRAMVAAWLGPDNPLVDHRHGIDKSSPPHVLTDDQLVCSGP